MHIPYNSIKHDNWIYNCGNVHWSSFPEKLRKNHEKFPHQFEPVLYQTHLLIAYNTTNPTPPVTAVTDNKPYQISTTYCCNDCFCCCCIGTIEYTVLQQLHSPKNKIILFSPLDV